MAWHVTFCGWCFATHLGSLAAWWWIDARPAETSGVASTGSREGLPAGPKPGSSANSRRGAAGGSAKRPKKTAAPTPQPAPVAVAPAARGGRSAVVAVVAAVLASGALAVGEQRRQAAAAEERDNALKAMAAGMRPPPPQPPSPPATPPPAAQGGQAPVQPATPPVDPLAGRRTLGNPNAPLRVVVFSDFQCPDCARMDPDVEALIDRGDVAVVPRHFPLCRACNPGMPSELHKDACRRAALAEAAGMLGGDAAYLKAHRALFAIQAKPNADPVAQVAQATGLDAAKLVETSQLPAIAEIIAGDVRTATSLGVTFTPMIFVNGREWKYYLVGGKLGDLIDRLRQDVPAMATPPSAAAKLVDDWLSTPRFNGFRSDAPRGHVAIDTSGGDPDAPELLVWLDYRLPGAKTVDGALRDLSKEGVRFTYRAMQFPACESCNPRSGFKGGDNRACLAAAAAVAVGDLGGDKAFASMHEWLLQNAATSDAPALIEAAVARGIDRNRFIAAFSTGDALAKARAEADALNEVWKLSTIPLVAVDGRPVPRWSHQGSDPKEFFRLLIEAGTRERHQASTKVAPPSSPAKP